MLCPIEFKRVALRWSPFAGVTQRGGNCSLGVSQRDTVLGSLWACDAGNDIRKVETDRVVVFRNRSIRGAEHALTSGIGFNESDFLV